MFSSSLAMVAFVGPPSTLGLTLEVRLLVTQRPVREYQRNEPH